MRSLVDGGLPIKWLLGIGLPLFLIILAGVVYLIVRNRKLTKELEFEVMLLLWYGLCGLPPYRVSICCISRCKTHQSLLCARPWWAL